MGVLKATLAIAGVYLVGLGVLLAVLFLLWNEYKIKGMYDWIGRTCLFAGRAPPASQARPPPL